MVMVCGTVFSTPPTTSKMPIKLTKKNWLKSQLLHQHDAFIASCDHYKFSICLSNFFTVTSTSSTTCTIWCAQIYTIRSRSTPQFLITVHHHCQPNTVHSTPSSDPEHVPISIDPQNHHYRTIVAIPRFCWWCRDSIVVVWWFSTRTPVRS